VSVRVALPLVCVGTGFRLTGSPATCERALVVCNDRSIGFYFVTHELVGQHSFWGPRFLPTVKLVGVISHPVTMVA
jgi:hypothetical protein